MTETPRGPEPIAWDHPQQPAPPMYGAPQPPPFLYAPRVPTDSPALGWATIAMAVVWVLASLLSLVLVVPAVDDYRQAAADGVDAIDVFTPYDAAGLLWIPVMIAAYVVTCMWLYRCRERVNALAPHAPHARRSGWVWGGWVVPIVALWFPYQVVRDIFRAGSPHPRSSALVGGWWAATIVFLVFDRLAPRSVPLMGPIDARELDAVIPLHVLAVFSGLVALALWIAVVRQIMRGQAQLGSAPQLPR